MRGMRNRGDRVKITTSKFYGWTGTVWSNIDRKAADYPDEWANAYHVMVDSGELVTLRWDQVKSAL